MIDAILGGSGLWAAIIAAAIAAFGFIRWDAKRDAKRDAEIKAARDAAKRRKDIQDAIDQSHSGGAADDWRKRLRDHG